MRKVVRTGVAVAVVLALLAGVIRLARTIAFFEIRRLELAGGGYLTPEQLARAIGIPSHTNIFGSLAPLEKKARAIPGVLEVRLSRRLPGTIRVTLREAEPVALAERNGRLVLLDAAGQVLPFDPTKPAADLPLSEVDPAVTGVLALVRETDPELFARVERGSRIKQDVALEVSGGRILFRSHASSAEVRDLAIVTDYLTRTGKRWRELDARFASRVVVRGAGA